MFQPHRKLRMVEKGVVQRLNIRLGILRTAAADCVLKVVACERLKALLGTHLAVGTARRYLLAPSVTIIISCDFSIAFDVLVACIFRDSLV